MKYLMGDTEQSAKDAHYDEQKLARLADHFANLVETGRVQAAGFLMSRNGKVFAHQTCGKLSFEAGRENELLRPDSIKRVASISKVITATAIMQLIENGLLWLNQPVCTIIPEFNTDMHKGITIWHLLTHTSGLPADGGYFCEPYPVERSPLLVQENWLKKAILSGPLHNKPGDTWSYSSMGFVVLSEIVSRLSGQHFNDYVEEKIFQVLGMNRSFMEVPDHLHKEITLNDDLSCKRLGTMRNRSFAPNGAGGVYTTLSDLNRLAQAFLNNGEWQGARILGKKSVEEMTRNQLDGIDCIRWGIKCKNYRSGLGWGFYADGNTGGPATYNHEGFGWCSIFIDPVEKFSFISFVADSNGWDAAVMVNPRTIAFAGVL